VIAERARERRGAAAMAVTAALSVFGAAGCDPRFEALTVPPPTAVAELSDEDMTIDLSKGVALGFECIARDGTPCDSATAEADDPAIAGVFQGYVDLLSPSVPAGSGQRVGSEPRAIFVVVGRAVGTTTLHIKSDDGDDDFSVEVTARTAGAE
jgi:hypothetical protein